MSMQRAAFVAAAALLAGCGGGGASAPAVATTPAPAATANGAFGPIPPISAAPVAITPASGGTTVALPPTNGITGALTLGAVDPSNGAGTSYTVQLAAAPYPGVPDFAQTTAGVRGEILYLLARPAQSVNYLGGATLTINLPPQYQGGSAYWIAIDAPSVTTWPTATNGYAGKINGTAVTFTFGNLLLSANQAYSIVLYAT